MAATFSIDEIRRKQKVKDARTRRACAAKRLSEPAAAATGAARESYTAEQKAYLDWCMQKIMDPDRLLLNELGHARFLVKLDRFGEEELIEHMKFLETTTTCRQICLSLGSVETNRDLRLKLDRLGLKKAFAFSKRGSSLSVRSAALAGSRTTDLVRFQLLGIKIPVNAAPLLAQMLENCSQLEEFVLNNTNLGDEGLAGIAVALGRCGRLYHISLSGCRLTDHSRTHIAKVISVYGVQQDESEWTASLRGEPLVESPPRPKLLLDLSRNALGDESAEAISDTLYNDKWLLGLNLSNNRLTEKGVSQIVDALTQANQSLAVLQLNDMRDPISTALMQQLDALLPGRRKYLQQIALESREKQLLLGSLMLKWGVAKDSVLEICHDTSSRARDQPPPPSSSLSGSSPAKSDAVRSQQRTDHTTTKRNTHREGIITTHHDNQRESDSVGAGNIRASGSSIHQAADKDTAHIQTIQYLIERLSALEAEQREASAYIAKLETENQSLRAQLEARDASTVLPMEVELIAELESSINTLAEQVDSIEREKLADVRQSMEVQNQGDTFEPSPARDHQTKADLL